MFQDVRPFNYVLLEPPKKTNGGKNEKENEKKNAKEEMAEALRDFKISWLSKLGNRVNMLLLLMMFFEILIQF